MSREHRLRQHSAHDLLGVRLPGTSNLNPIWRLNINPADLPWIRDHKVQSEIVYPAAGYICMAIEALRVLGWRRFWIYSAAPSADPWVENARGLIMV